MLKTQPFHFYHNKDVDYCIPAFGPRDNYTDAIGELPIMQSPEVFGLHPNADISYYTHATKELWLNLVDLQPRTGGATGGISREERIGMVARDIQSKIPEPFDMPVLRKEIPNPMPVQVSVKSSAS